jgi:hypothetical protein
MRRNQAKSTRCGGLEYLEWSQMHMADNLRRPLQDADASCRRTFIDPLWRLGCRVCKMLAVSIT